MDGKPTLLNVPSLLTVAATLLWPVWPSCQSSTQSSTTPSYLSQVKTRYSLLMSAQWNSHVWVFLINSGSSFINWQQESYQNLDWSKEEIISLFTFCENIYRLLVLFHLKPQPAWWFYSDQAWWRTLTSHLHQLLFALYLAADKNVEDKNVSWCSEVSPTPATYYNSPHEHVEQCC